MITRKLIKKSREKSLKFFINQKKKGKKSSIYFASKFILRSNDFSINFNLAFKLLNNIDLFYDNINQHWAETDGTCIRLNTFKDYKNDKDNILTDTLIHEALHDIILRNNKHTIPEEKEHKIMELVYPSLISQQYRSFNLKI